MDLKKKIQQHGQTLTSVADKMGVTLAAVSKLCSNDNPNYASLQKLANALGISVSKLVAEEEEEATTTVICPKCGTKLQVEVKTIKDE